jgi:hypothetical protein
MADEIKTQLVKLEEEEKELAQKQSELEKVKVETADYEQKKEALTKELDRVQTLINKAREEKRAVEVKDISFQEKFKLEQFQKARERIVKDLNLTDEAKQKSLFEEYNRIKSDAIDADIIYKDLEKAYVSLNAPELLEAKRTLEARIASGADYNANASSAAAAGAGAPSTEDVRLDEGDVFAMKYSGIPREAYKDMKKRGLLK